MFLWKKMKEIISELQSTLVITTSFISNNRLSRSENLVPVLTRKLNNVSRTSSFGKCGCSIYFFLKSANLIC